MAMDTQHTDRNAQAEGIGGAPAQIANITAYTGDGEPRAGASRPNTIAMACRAVTLAGFCVLAGLAAANVSAAPLSSAAAPAQEPMADHVTLEHLGSVTFDNSCNEAQKPAINRAVALMHSFQFGSAINGFHAVLAADPTCVIAYWGIALSSWSNPFAGFKAPAQIAQGLQAVNDGRAASGGSKRERAYLDAVAHLYVDADKLDQDARVVAYESAMQRVAADYPQDIEARIFYALAIAAAADRSDKTYARQLRAGAILEALFKQYPDHPGLAHYIIHAYDEPPLAAHAAEAARRYSAIAPSTPHALHMPSHTFTRTGEWQASIDTNLASEKSARAAGQPADELHASDYMEYAYLQTGQDRAAQQLVDAAQVAFARFDPAHANGAAPASAAFFAHAAIPARYALERHDWAAATQLPTLATRFAYADAITYFARGVGAAHLHDAAGAKAAIDALSGLHRTLVGEHEGYWATQVDIQRRAVAALLAYASGNVAEALSGLRAAANLEGKSGLASVTPGPLVPAREMLGDMLLETQHPAEALKEFQATLVQQPNRFWSIYGAARAAESAGKHAAALGYYKKLLGITPAADQPARAELVQAQRETQR